MSDVPNKDGYYWARPEHSNSAEFTIVLVEISSKDVPYVYEFGSDEAYEVTDYTWGKEIEQ